MIDTRRELELLEDFEGTMVHSGISAKQRFLELLKLKHLLPNQMSILDAGGNRGTAEWLKLKFQGSTVTLLNSCEKELTGYTPSILGNVESFHVENRFDCIFAGEVLEHTYNPEGFIASCLLALKQDGYLIITTPDLACLYNRLFLLFGWTPGNYSASLKTSTGNPFLNRSYDSFGYIGDHKSVFTRKALRELLKEYGFRIIASRGYSYGATKPFRAIGDRHLYAPFGSLRFTANALLPHCLREGQLLLCQRKNDANEQKALDAILHGSIWEIN